MIRHSILFTSLLSLCVIAGCASATDPSEDQVADTQDQLTSSASQLVGSFWTHRPAKAGFARLELKSNGHYSAQVDPDGKIMCITSPCLLPESGTWNATQKAGGGYSLRIHPAGQATRVYDATKTGGSSVTLTLVRGGVTETLAKLGANACLDDGDCKAADECAPRYCLMFCAFNDPFCCGPSTCKPKAPVVKHCGGIAGIACAANEDCVDDPTDGCDPTKGGADCSGICQPKAPVVKHCGGIAGIACAANEDCVDDPTDGCDPKKGGADCSGICQPK